MTPRHLGNLNKTDCVAPKPRWVNPTRARANGSIFPSVSLKKMKNTKLKTSEGLQTLNCFAKLKKNIKFVNHFIGGTNKELVFYFNYITM